MALDVAGYSARTEADEARTTAEVAALRKVIEAIADKHGGRVFNTAGDGFMLEFGSSLAAVEAASELVTTCEPKVRVGVHLGDVVVQPNGDLLGHGVNVAARLMAKSEPGGALVSADVRRTIRGPLAERLVSRGIMQLEKMAETLEAFALNGVAVTPTVPPKQQSEPLLAVLPFDNLSSDPEMQFFSDGVSEDIIQRLANGAKLRVIGRTSSFQFRGDRKAEVARALNCSHVLDGSIRRAGSRVRVAAHLAESASRTTIWSEKFDRGLEDIFAIQDEISESIAASLNQTFSPAPTMSVDPAVYDLYLRGNVQTTEPEALRAAIALLEEVTRRAPHFAPGWGKTAELRAWMLYYSPFADRRAMAARARHELERALALVPDLPSALIARAALLPPWGSFMEGEEADLPLQACSVDAATMGLSALFPESVGRMRESLARSRRGFELDALNAYSCHMLGQTLWFNGQFAQARTRFEDNLARWPDLKVSANNLILLCADLGDWNAVDALLAPERLAKFPLLEFDSSARRYVASKRHRPPQVQNEFVKHMLDDVRQNGYADTTALTFAAHFGAIDEAYDIAAKARLRPAGDGRDAMGYDAYRTYIMFHAAWPELRSDPRFIALCARLGLVEYWLSTQKWPDCADTVPYDFRAECERHRQHPKDTYPL